MHIFLLEMGFDPWSKNVVSVGTRATYTRSSSACFQTPLFPVAIAAVRQGAGSHSSFAELHGLLCFCLVIS
jgi:hypothetical protein